jgi:hypothetical protein
LYKEEREREQRKKVWPCPKESGRERGKKMKAMGSAQEMFCHYRNQNVILGCPLSHYNKCSAKMRPEEGL